MSGLAYVGKAPSNPGDVINELAVNNLINTTFPNQSSVAAEAASVAAATYATQTYVNNQAATYALPSYLATQDLLNLPAAYVGTPSPTALGSTSFYGAASLNSSAQVPITQMPVLGTGYIVGPVGATATAAGTTSNVPLRIADWNVGQIGMQFRPMVFMHALVTGLLAHPIIEVKIANSTTAPAYSAMTLVAQGLGRSYYNDYAAVAVVPVGDTTGESYPTLLGATYNVWLTAWLWDLNSQNTTITTSGLVNTAAFFLRGTL